MPNPNSQDEPMPNLDKKLGKPDNCLCGGYGKTGAHIRTDIVCPVCDTNEEPKWTLTKSVIQEQVVEARLEENKKPLKLLKNFKPKPGEMTAYNFGSAGAGMVYKEWQNWHEDRIKKLSQGKND